MENYKKKYFKYKNKYLELKNKSESYNLSGGVYLKENDEVLKYLKETSKLIYELNSDEYFNEYQPIDIFYGLNISLKLEEIQKIFNENKYLQIRPYAGEKILTIGCGNRRIDSGNVSPYLDSKSDIEFKRKFDLTHSHNNEFTIDATLVANPSIIGVFDDESKFLTIPDHSFNLIYFEGSGYPENNIDEIKRLLNNKTTSFCIAMDEGDYFVHSCYIDGKFKKIEK